MIFKFNYNNLSEKDELQKVIKEEATKHFGTEFTPISEGDWHSVDEDNWIKFVVKNINYAYDIENAKQKFYNDISNILNCEKTTNICSDISEVYFKDFLSEVFANLSFIPKVMMDE